MKAVTEPSLFGLACLTVVGLLIFSAYTFLLFSHESASRVVSYSLVNPLIAVILGFFLGNETPVKYFAIRTSLYTNRALSLLYGERFLDLKNINKNNG